MLVTFGREATRELRERVRGRFVATERALADPAGARRHDDPVIRLLAEGDDAVVALRRARLRAALAGFDAATIATTHQFCQDMLTGLGIVGDTDPDGTFVERIDDVVTEVVDDFYLRKYAVPGAKTPDFDRATALAVGQAVVNDPGARIEPGRDAPDAAGARAGFAEAVRAEVERRKRGRRLFTFDDMLLRLHRALRHPQLGAAARARLRARFSVVLVDEFQDTDPIQWDILRAAFHEESAERPTALTFIGDPKQAIYAFRGADVVSYLQAVETAGHARGADEELAQRRAAGPRPGHRLRRRRAGRREDRRAAGRVRPPDAQARRRAPAGAVPSAGAPAGRSAGALEDRAPDGRPGPRADRGRPGRRRRRAGRRRLPLGGRPGGPVAGPGRRRGARAHQRAGGPGARGPRRRRRARRSSPGPPACSPPRAPRSG